MSRTLIKGATVYDGSGQQPKQVDVAIDDERIVAVEDDIPGSDADVVLSPGLVLAPGFIDMHSHADFTLSAFPAAINSLSQGVTTEVVGNCGWTPAPLASKSAELRTQWQRTAAGLGPDLDWTWTDFGSFLDALDHARPAVNCVPLVGHSAIRTATFGIDDRHPSPSELDEMRTLLEDALRGGAWGLSTGLVYPPSSFSSQEEVHALAQVVASRGGLYSTHMRDEGNQLQSAVAEAVEVARQTRVRVQISHIKAAGPANHGKIFDALDAISRARAEGLAVGCDVYPYSAGSTVLLQLLPSWAVTGGADALLERLRSTDIRDRIRAELLRDETAYLNRAGGWKNVMIAAVGDAALRRFQGRYVPEIARSESTDEFDVLFELLVADQARTTMILFLMDPADVEEALDHESAVVGSDQLGVTSPDANVHPRSYGTFARVMRRAADRGEGPLADQISRATGRTARRLGLADRGFIRPGYTADLVLFDPATIRDCAMYAEPSLIAEGIERVYVAGALAVDGGAVMDARLGRVLRRPAS